MHRNGLRVVRGRFACSESMEDVSKETFFMRINYNLSAMLTNNQLLHNERNQRSAAERLASGLKINHAKDDPAGMAISNKMDVQIEGIRQASRNSSDGISVLESADSSLNEVTSIIQRMRELAVQAANDTNGLDDRQAIQAEIDSLSVEIDRISKNTEFNKKILLDGSLSRRSYTDNRKVTVTNVGDGVPADKYGITITADARQAVFRGMYSETINLSISGYGTDNGAIRTQELKDTFEDGKLKSEAAGRLTINGQIIEFKGGETYEEIYERLREGAEVVDVTCISSVRFGSPYFPARDPGCSFLPDASGKYEDTAGYMPNPSGWDGGDPLVFISKDYGSAEKLNISCDNAVLATALGLARFGGVDGGIGHSASADAAENSTAEIRCYRSTNRSLEDMPSPPVILDENNPAHKEIFDNNRDKINTGGQGGKKMVTPALVYDGDGEHLVDLDDPKNRKYTTFYDKLDSIPAKLSGNIEVTLKKGGTLKKGLVNIDAGDTAEEVFEKLKNACSSANADVFLTDSERNEPYSVITGEYDYSQTLVFRGREKDCSLTVACDNPELASMLGLPVCEWNISGKDCKATFTDKDDNLNNGTQRVGFNDSATITTKGNKIRVTDLNGFELEFEAEKKTCATFYSDWTSIGRICCDGTMKSGEAAGEISGVGSTLGNYENFPYGKEVKIEADVTDYGMMTVHVGANKDQIIDMDIPEISTKALDIENLNVRSEYTAQKALERLDAALNKVSKTRSRLGAYQNRLESTVASLNANDEDLTASVSRIRDVDMAEETTEYTQYSILVQAATSVLAQANDMPQQALQLIQ